MRVPVWAFSVSLWLLTANGGLAWSQTSNPTESLQKPSSPPHAESQKAPVQKTASSKTPVIPPHGPLHPQKPASSSAKSGTAGQPPAPVSPPAEAAAPSQAVPPEKLPDPEKPEGTPVKLPRFASLRSDDVNMRAGPGTRYRIDWVYKRRDLPVEIEREFDNWRWVRDADGIQGWVNQATLMGRRSFIVQKTEATLRSEPSEAAAPVAVLKPGVIGRIRSCEAASDWCNVQTGSYRGYMHRTQLWGVFPGEVINP
jgi:SH3-like domain-containing protein